MEVAEDSPSITGVKHRYQMRKPEQGEEIGDGDLVSVELSVGKGSGL